MVSMECNHLFQIHVEERVAVYHEHSIAGEHLLGSLDRTSSSQQFSLD
jgi:hypothetical protein